MRFLTHFLAITALLSSAVVAQDPGASPTASLGCEPHEDHWHCDGPASTSISFVTLSATEIELTTSSTISPTMPSPTESIGCEPHNDHWHCDGPAVTSSASSTIASPTSSGSSNGDESGVETNKVHVFLVLGLSIMAAGFNV